MHPERALIGGITQADIVAIAEHPGLSKRQGRAKQLWRELLSLAGGKSGKVQINEAQMAALIGGGTLWRSKASEGPLEALLRVGAVERAEPGWWFVFTPSDADKPRRAVIEDDPQQRLPGIVSDDPPAAVELPRLLALPYRAGLRPESGRSPGVPPDSGQSNGGKGGRCARVSQSEQEQQEIKSSCYSWAPESGGTPDEDDSPAHWADARTRLIECGVYARLVPDLVREAERNGARPRDILELCRYFTQNPDGLNLNGGALKVAVEHWRPRLEYNAPGLWPQEKLPPITVAASVYSGVGYEDEQKRDQQTGIVRTMTKQGFSREDINKRLMQLGLPTVVTKAEIAAHPLRFKRGTNSEQK